jgi:signal transduction histidine kinase
MRTSSSDARERQQNLVSGSLAWLAVAYPCLMVECIVLKPSMAIPGAIWPPHAIAFTAYYLLPWSRWPFVPLLTLGSDLLVIPLMTMMVRGAPPPLWYSLQVSVSGTLICAGMAAALRVLRRANHATQILAPQAPLVVLALVLGSLAGSLLTTYAHAIAARVPIDSLDVGVRVLSSVLSVVTLCPLLLGLLRGFAKPAPPPPTRRWEAAALGVTIVGLCLFYLFADWPFDRFLELMLLAVPLLWFALRFSGFSCALACAGLSIAVAVVAAHGFGAFPALVLQGNWQNGVLSTQIFLLIACGEALLINRMVLEQHALLEDAARKQAMLLAYARALDSAEETVRKATAVDLHDGVAQIIAGQGMILSTMRRRMSDASPMTALLDQALAAAREAQTAVRATIQDLSPPEIERASLQEILSWLTQYFAVRYSFALTTETSGEISLTSEQLRLVYRVLRELIYNACKHSRSETAHIQVRLEVDHVEITVSDAGVGYDRFAPVTDGRTRFGLSNLAERIAVAGGRMTIDSEPGHGCRVAVQLPVFSAALA